MKKKLGEVKRNSFHWEYYNRIYFIVNKIQKLKLKTPRIIDIGGATGDNLLKQFGLTNVNTLDILDNADIKAKATKIPLKDNSVDIAVCIDMLEHTPRKKRRAIINEITRITSKIAYIVAPIDSIENRKAEKIVLNHIDNAALEEHSKNGLVDFKKIEMHLKSLAKKNIIIKYEKDYIDNLQNWVTMFVGREVDTSELYQQIYFLENKFVPRRCCITIYKSSL